MGSCKSSNYSSKGKKKQIVVFLGSNSSSSINKTLLEEISSASIFSQKPFKITVPNLNEVHFFNSDLIKEHSKYLIIKEIPHSVYELLRSVDRASAFIFITPEHNGAVSSTILNAYEWITEVPRAYGQCSNGLYHKPVAVMSCSYISQNQIKDIKLMTKTSNVKLFKESFYVDLKQDQIDPDTKKLSPKLKKKLHEWLERFARFI